MVVAEPVGGLQLRQRVLVKPEFIAGFPWARQLQLIKDAEFHDVSPGIRLLFSRSVIPGGAESSLDQFRAAEGGLR
jgi:hypothetical protein